MELTARELGDHTGFKSCHIHTYAKRGTLIKNDNGHFDMDNPTNRSWYELKRTRVLGGKNPIKPVKRKSGRPKGSKTVKDPESEEVKNPPPKKVLTEEEKLEKESLKRKYKDQEEFEREKRRLQLEELKKKNKLKDFEIETKMGDFVPLKDVVNALNFKTSELNKIFLSETEKYIQKICKREEIDVNDAIHYKKGVVELLNKIIKMAEAKTLTQL